MTAAAQTDWKCATYYGKKCCVCVLYLPPSNKCWINDERTMGEKQRNTKDSKEQLRLYKAVKVAAGEL